MATSTGFRISRVGRALRANTLATMECVTHIEGEIGRIRTLENPASPAAGVRQGSRVKMRYVKRYVPIDPVNTKTVFGRDSWLLGQLIHTLPPDFRILLTSINMLLGIKRVLQNIREHGHIIAGIPGQIGKVAHMHLKSGLSCLRGGRRI